jgi:hypothetical protein
MSPMLGPLVLPAIAATLLLVLAGAFGYFFFRLSQSDDLEGPRENPHEEAGRGATRDRGARSLLSSEASRAALLERMGVAGARPVPLDHPVLAIERGVSAVSAPGGPRGARLYVFLRERSGAVPSPAVAKVAALLGPGPDFLAASATIFATSAFTREAWAAAARAPVELVDGKQLEQLARALFPEGGAR